MTERRGLLDHREDPENNDHNDDEDGCDYDDAITATGYGMFHYWLIIVGGFANASDAIEILCVSILMPAAECDLHMSSEDKGWLSAMVFVGMMVGGYIWGVLGDMYGRRNVLIVALLVNGVAGLTSSFVQSYESFLGLRFLSGLGVGGSIPLVWAYVCEFQPSHRRGGALSVLAAFWMVGNVMVAGFGLAIIPYDIGFVSPSFTYNSWRIFLTLCAMPAIIVCIVLIWLPESPMFLLLKGRQEETIMVLRKVYSQNTKKPPHTYPVRSIAMTGLKGQTDSGQNCLSTFNTLFINMWRQTNGLFSRSLIRVTLLMLTINFAIQFGYYGLWLWFPELFNRLQQYYNEHPDAKVSVCDLGEFHGNKTQPSHCSSDEPQVDPQALVNSLITAIAPLPANLWTIFYMDKLGRKFFLVFSMVLSGLAAFAIYFVKSGLHNLIVSCVFGAVATIGFNALDCLGAELFPTHLRTTALAVTLLAARVGAIAGTVSFGYLIDVYCAIPMFLVAFLLICGGLLGLFLPNTTRTALT
ncbi:hypothetical protein Pmani_024615 [Petrolisthes manimaculis]|uniref:Major facilitator superfamily (MFS) profile domain-containing protein n=1 Tax=Petrolisthes manimaculis TaxID=1843537 RepID=A0AAE1P8V7_9EUCA|nr:hypothetical protein Pmani_024615 [Petrolisthes manimaculis]